MADNALIAEDPTHWMFSGTSGRTDPTQLGKPLYYDDLPERERYLDPKDRSAGVIANFLGLLPYARAGALAQERGESFFGGTQQYERQRRALQNYWSDAYESAPDSVKVLNNIGMPGGAVSMASKVLPFASRPIASGAGLGIGLGGTAGYFSPVEPDTGDIGARLPSALLGAGFGGALGAGGAKLASDPKGSVNALRNWLAENTPGTNQLNMFIGPKARTWNAELAAKAEAMEKAGHTPEEIWKATSEGPVMGTFRDVDSRLKQEIPDQGAKIVNPVRSEDWLSQQHYFNEFAHPEFQKAYPEFDPMVQGGYGKRTPELGGGYTAGPAPYHRPIISAEGPTATHARSAALHEYQHGAQQIEGFATGTNPISAYEEMATKYPSLYSPIPSSKQEEKLANALYHANAGEVAARNVQERDKRLGQWLKENPGGDPKEWAAKNPPWTTEDVPRDQQIVRFGGDGPQLMFGGPKAKTADKAAFAEAQAMTEAGHEPKAVWDKTGWFQGADGKWKFEIPDHEAVKTERDSGKLSEVLSHPGLEQAYPDFMKNTRVVTADFLGGGAAYSPGREGNIVQRWLGYKQKPLIGLGPQSETPLNDLLHESDHGIQHIEGFAKGANRERLMDDPAVQTEAQSLFNRAKKVNAFPTDAETLDWAKQYAALKAYKNSAGEVSARNVEKRMNMTPEERRATPPWETEDVPRNQQIVRFGNNGVSESRGDPKTSLREVFSNALNGAVNEARYFPWKEVGYGAGLVGLGGYRLYHALKQESPRQTPDNWDDDIMGYDPRSGRRVIR